MDETDSEQGLLVDFVDVHGVPRGTVVPAEQYAEVRDAEAGFAGLIMDVFETGTDRGIAPPVSFGPHTEEIRAVPDPESTVPLPWTDGRLKNVRCSLFRQGERFECCPRNALRGVLSELDDSLELRVGTEIEYTVLEGDGEARPPSADERPVGLTGADQPTESDLAAAAVSRPRPYDARPLERSSAYVLELSRTAREMGVGIEAVLCEGSPGQFEASLDHHPALRHADYVVSMRRAIRAVGRQHGLDTSFIPYPFADYEGNGLHLHLSLHDGDEYVFADPDDDLNLSETGYQFVAGVLDHADALTALCAPTVNSYKRFRPDTFAPVDRTYGLENRTALVRIPRTDPEETRIEVRLADSYANPYLATAGVVAAGLDGIRSDRDPGQPSDEDRYESTDGTSLPDSLGSALDALEDDAVVVDALGEGLVELFCKLKRNELERFAGSVTDWELDEYVDKL